MTTYSTYVDPNATGAGDGSTLADAYTSLSAWEAAEQALYSSGDIAIADCWRTGATKDTTRIDVGGWTTGVIPKIVVNDAHRHEGKWADQQSGANYIYQLVVTNNDCMSQSTSDWEVDGLLLETTGASDYKETINISAPGKMRNFISRSTLTSGGSNNGIYGENVSGIVEIENGVIYGFLGEGVSIYAATDGDIKLRNLTVYGNSVYGIRCINDYNVVAINCASFNNGTDFYGTFNSSSDYNVSSDTSAPGTNVATGKSSYSTYFTDHTNGDFHLKDTSSNLWGLSGTDLSGTFTDDIDGDTRSNWDIGADEYVAVGGATGKSNPIMGPLGGPLAGPIG